MAQFPAAFLSLQTPEEEFIRDLFNTNGLLSADLFQPEDLPTVLEILQKQFAANLAADKVYLQQAAMLAEQHAKREAMKLAPCNKPGNKEKLAVLPSKRCRRAPENNF